MLHLSIEFLLSLKLVAMGNIYNTNRLIQFMYRETGILQSFEVENALQEDAELNRTFRELKKAKQSLPKVLFAPRKDAIDAILRYSAETAMEIGFSGK